MQIVVTTDAKNYDIAFTIEHKGRPVRLKGAKVEMFLHDPTDRRFRRQGECRILKAKLGICCFRIKRPIKRDMVGNVTVTYPDVVENYPVTLRAFDTSKLRSRR